MMGLGGNSVKVDWEIDPLELKGVDGSEIVNVKDGLERELEGCRNSCSDMEGRSRNAEERCLLLEVEIEKRKSEFELLEGKFSAMEVEKVKNEVEVQDLKRRSVELEKRINQFENENKVVGGEKGAEKVIGFVEDEDEVIQLMIENKVLQCEKKTAESEVEVWKLKYRELELRVLELEKENSVLRGGQIQLAGMMNSERQMHKQSTEERNSGNGLDLVTSSEHLDKENNVVYNNDTIHAGNGISSSWCPHKGPGVLQGSGTRSKDMPSEQPTQVGGRKRGFVSEAEMDRSTGVRKQLTFGEEGSPTKKMAPSTPGGGRPSSLGIIDISDSEDELANRNVCMPCCGSQLNSRFRTSTNLSSGNAVGNGNKINAAHGIKRTHSDHNDEEDMDGFKGSIPFMSTPKRRRASNIITSDSETDDEDDNIPIGKLKLGKLDHPTISEEAREFATPRRRLVPLRKCRVKNETPHSSPSNSYNIDTSYRSGIPTDEGLEDDEMEEDRSESDTEGETLGGFIVNSSEASDVSDCDGGSGASEDVSDSDEDFDKVLSRIRRNGEHKLEWEFEADLLAAFGRDSELCMKAVCALYRQQTCDEQFSKETIHANRRGFSQCDAFRGTALAEFLTDGDPEGDLKKSVEELQKYDSKGPELCRQLATHYSKQLFAIYKNKEDPLFLLS